MDIINEYTNIEDMQEEVLYTDKEIEDLYRNETEDYIKRNIIFADLKEDK